MKKLLMICVLLSTIFITAFAQDMDYTTFDIVAQQGNLSIVVKDNNYRLLVGSIKKPKIVYLLGFSKQEALQKMIKLEEVAVRSSRSKDCCTFPFCGISVLVSSKGTENKTRYTIQRTDKNSKFVLSHEELIALRQALE